MVRLSENPEYGFAVGRVRALEASLLNRVQYERLVVARDGGEFIAALAETGYSRFLESGTPDVSLALDRAESENLAFLSEYALDQWLLQIFQLPSTFRRLKAAVKRAVAKNESGAAAVEKDGMPSFASRISEAVAGFDKSHDPAFFDVALDRLMQQLQLETASTSEFMLAYLALGADVENLRALVRMKALPAAGENQVGEMAAAFLPGGSLALRDFLAALSEPWPGVVERFTKVPPYGAGDEVFRDYLEQGTAAVTGQISFVRLERYGREILLRFLHQVRYATFGYEPLVAFFLFHENELRNLRQLHAAKLAGVAKETAQDLVAYVD